MYIAWRAIIDSWAPGKKVINSGSVYVSSYSKFKFSSMLIKMTGARSSTKTYALFFCL
jgi:hypothetical protein